ncbi:Zinc finger protein 112 [Araneus ventricosus]|uniref:Zinc finger protein 112 n=1 Tax=Araneus ventricosus TaxID=182803 RepID=A0A4Y2C4C3_ARAVE|nr:Zinc finger protein 112 [Araneus ventricosus]
MEERNFLEFNHDTARLFICDLSNTELSCEKEFEKHCSDHTKVESDMCGPELSENSSFMVPKSNRVKEESGTCDIGDLQFVLKSNLTNNDSKPFKCEICDPTFTTNTCLKRHSLVHTGEKSYVFDVCSKAFSQKGELLAHSRRFHINERSFVCDECDKALILKAELKHHFRIQSRPLAE